MTHAMDNLARFAAAQQDRIAHRMIAKKGGISFASQSLVDNQPKPASIVVAATFPNGLWAVFQGIMRRLSR